MDASIKSLSLQSVIRGGDAQPVIGVRTKPVVEAARQRDAIIPMLIADPGIIGWRARSLRDNRSEGEPA